MSREWKAIHIFKMRFLTRSRLSAARHNGRSRRRLSRTLATRTHRISGRWGSEARELQLAAQILASVGHITRSNPIIAGGTESRLIIITTGTMRFMTVLEILAETIRLSHVTTSGMARIQWARQLATIRWETRSGWRPARSGSVVVTRTRETAHRRDISSAWNGSLHRIR